MDDTAKAQEEVLAFLADPATHGGGVEKVRRIDTHAASVFLAGDRALKIKRAVRFPFLDYSTLAKRKAACAAEIEVNRRLAPELYRGVVAITREGNGRLALGGDGAPVEWAVDMARFDENRTLDHLTREIDDDLADALGRAVAAAHATAPVVDAEPWIKAIGSYIDEHVETFREHKKIFPAADAAALAAKSRAHYQRIVPLLRERGGRGLVRRIHGDLHLGNIALIDGRPVLFDAIEFSDVIGSGDVLYDLAFLLMDLVERELPQAANIVFNRYLAETRRDTDLDALAALPFFLSMRAAIRAKVTAARMERAEAAERDKIATSARAYFDFALRAITPPPPSTHRHRRPVGHRQDAAGARAGGAHRADARRRRRCAPMSSARRCSAPARLKSSPRRLTRLTSPRASMGRSPTRRAALSRPAIRRSSTRCSRRRRSAMRSPQRREPAKFRCGACFSPRAWRRESPASAGARRTPPMPMLRWSRRRKATSWAR